jgi:hypothetical protein
MSGAGGNGGAGGVGGVGGINGNACNNPADIAVITASVPIVRQIAVNCWVNQCDQHIFEQEFLDCVNPCIRENVDGAGLSVGCTDCYGQETWCSKQANCISACGINVCSPLCTQCENTDNCILELSLCAGRNSFGCPEP